MAGEPITNFPFLGSPEPSDKFYVVDVSDTTQSPDGSSKQTDLSEIVTSLTTLLPYIHLRGTAFGGQGQVTGDIEVDQGAGGVITLRFGNGDIIGLGVEYGGYSAISFYDATSNQTVYLYLRGGDLYIQNVDTGQGTGNLIGTILGLNATRVGYAQLSVDNQGHDGLIGTINAPLLNPNNFYGTDVTGRKGWLRLPGYWARHCAFITQSGTNAPTEVVVETDLDGVAIGGTQNYNWTRTAAGTYLLTINAGLGGWDFTGTNPVVKITNGNVDHVVYSTTLGTTNATTMLLQIKSFNSTNGSLTDGLMTRTLIEVELYG
jgi:hypothetical protein